RGEEQSKLSEKLIALSPNCVSVSLHTLLIGFLGSQSIHPMLVEDSDAIRINIPKASKTDGPNTSAVGRIGQALFPRPC
ncbi:MAG TPA: hypothetical protein V6C97_27675, partial [Oculatellaceae cyanobacterium]